LKNIEIGDIVRHLTSSFKAYTFPHSCTF